MMKNALLVALTALGGLAFQAHSAEIAAMPLAEARGQIDRIVNASSGAEMAAVMARLSAADQRQFLADVNKAVSEMPGSIEERTAKSLNLNQAAVRSAKKGNAMALLAEVFATVPPESLTVINERFASNLLNRSANPNVTYSDAQYTNIAVKLMKVINDRLAESDNAATRSAFAVVMLARASNGSPADLTDTLISTMPKGSQEIARTEWIPSALGANGREQSYEPLLASADAGRRPDPDSTLVIAGPQHLDALLQDLTGRGTDPTSSPSTRSPTTDAAQNMFNYQVPVLGDGVGDAPMIPRPDEPKPY